MDTLTLQPGSSPGQDSTPEHDIDPGGQTAARPFDSWPDGGHSGTRAASDATSGPAAHRAWLLASIGVLLLSAALYIPSWSGGLVWDDHFLVSGRAIGGGHSLRACFTKPFLDHFFRPLVSVSFLVENRLWRGDPLGYHVTNTVLHVLTTGVVMSLLLAAFDRRRAQVVSALGGLLFAIQPAQVGAVAWIGGRTDCLAELFLAIFALWVVRAARSGPDERPLALALATVAWMAAIFTKEQTLAALPLVPLAFRCWRPRRGPFDPRVAWRATVPFVLAAAVFVGMGLFLGMPRPPHIPRGAVAAAEQVARTIAFYTIVLVAPQPKWMHTFSLGSLERAGVWPLALGGASALLTAALFIRWMLADSTSRAAAWFVAMAALLLAPVIGILPLPFLLVAPYRAGLAGIGVAGAAAYALGVALPASIATRRRAGPGFAPSGGLGSAPFAAVGGLLAVLVAWHALLTVGETLLWHNEAHLFRFIVHDDPYGVVGHYTYAEILSSESDHASSARQYEAVLTRMFGSQRWRDGATASGVIQSDPAVRAFIRQNMGGDFETRRFVAGVYADAADQHMRADERAAALALIQAGDVVCPGQGYVQALWAKWYAESGDDDDAFPHARHAIADMPELAWPHSFLGRYYADRGEWNAAESEDARWLRIEPSSQEAQAAVERARAHLPAR